MTIDVKYLLNLGHSVTHSHPSPLLFTDWRGVTKLVVAVVVVGADVGSSIK